MNTQSVAPPRAPEFELPFTLLGMPRYELGDVLDHGNFGVVFSAYDRERRERVALKWTPDPLEPEDVPAYHRFVANEVGIQTELSGCGRVPVLFDSGQAPLARRVPLPGKFDDWPLVTGGSFLSMELFSGSLDAHFALFRESGGPERALNVSIEVSEGVREVHGCGIVHRDLTLKNVLLGHRPGGELSVAVADFGLARRLRDPVNDERELRCGSAQFAAPEQLMGADTDSRMDIFSLGVVIHLLLTGESPFDEGQIRWRTAAYTIAFTSPLQREAVSSRLVADVSAELPPECRKLLESMLETDPANRPSIMAVLSHLYTLKSSGALFPLEPAPLEHSPDTIDPLSARRRPFRTAAAGFLTGFAGTGVLAIAGLSTPPSPPSISEMDDRSAHPGRNQNLFGGLVVPSRPTTGADDAHIKLEHP